MAIMKRGDCEHCGVLYRYTLWHSGFGDNSYAYCDHCGLLATISYLNPHAAALPPLSLQYAEIDESWEPHLQACHCGGRFRKGAGPRCPHCREKLSPSHAGDHIKAQAIGAPRGWQWQASWNGVYCMAIDNPQAPGTPLQRVDPIARPDPERTRRRWPLLFSLSR
jgi:hypothetical protein